MADSEDRAVKKLLVEFSQNTTCHGLAQISAPNRGRVIRLIWFFLVLLLLGGLVWQILAKVFEYTSFGTSTELHEEYAYELDFPAVTICNTNKFFAIYDELELATVDALMRASSPYRDGAYDKWWAHEVELYLRNRTNISEGSRNRTNNGSRFLLSEELFAKGWLLNKTTFRHCSFQQRACSLANFTPSVTPMGLCYTFTPGFPPKQNVPGSGHGLVLQLDIGQFQYSSHPDFGNPSAGVKVHVHNHGEPPEVEKFGLGIPSGHAGHVVIKMTERNLMYKPWGVCDRQNKLLRHNRRYSIAACMKECGAEHVIKQCGCSPYWADEYEVEECDAWRILECSGAAEADFLSNYTVHECNCSLPCSFVTFDPTVSYSTFPSIEVGAILQSGSYRNETDAIRGATETFQNIDSAFEKVRAYRENHVLIDVYYDSLSFARISQSKAVTEISLMSDLGGLLGLWLGMSLVTLGEFLQLAANSVRRWTSCRHGNQRASRVDAESGTGASKSTPEHNGRKNVVSSNYNRTT